MTRSRSFLSKKKIFKKKIFNYVKGFIGSRKNLYKVSSKAFIKALYYSKRDRKKRSGFFKQIYITKINSYLRLLNVNYSFFKNYLLNNNILINNKIFYKILISNNGKEIFFSLIKSLFYL